MRKFSALLIVLLLVSLLPVLAQQPESATATISSGGSLSTAISMGKRTPTAIIMPAAWTSAGLAFQASINGTDYYKVKVLGSRWIETVAADDWVVVTPADGWSWRYVKFESVNSSGVAVNQGGDRTITLVYR
jgi:hypothetical protein